MKAILSIHQDISPLYIKHKKRAKPGNLLLRQFREILVEEISNSQCTISSLASRLYLSERQLYRRIKELTGLTPNLYIRQIRMEQAYKLITTQKCNSTKEVAAAVGFRRADYFANLFKKEFGLKPKSCFSK